MAQKLMIVTDSASDFTREALVSYSVKLVPMVYTCGTDTVTIIDDKTLPVSALWQRMLAGEHLVTSQPSVGSFLDVFEQAKREGSAVVCITISSGMSGTYQAAVTARDMADYAPIYVVDSKSAAAKEKMLVLYACRLRDEGRMTAEEIATELTSFRDRIRLYACLDTLEYLVRGGRLSKGAGLIGTALDIKPIITLPVDGSVQLLHKTRGMRRSMDKVRDLFLADGYDKNFPVIPIFSYDSSNCMQFLETLHAQTPVDDFLPPEEIGATIGCHIGPRAFGIVFVKPET